MNLLRFFKGHLGAVIICAALLVIQANLELSLPNYMSDIVDVGLQQSGISSPVPDSIRERDLADLELFMTPTECDAVESVYTPANQDGVRTYIGTPEQAAMDSGTIATIMILPECTVLALQDGIDASSLSGASSRMTLSEDNPDTASESEDGNSLIAFQNVLATHGGELSMETVRALYEDGLVNRNELIAVAQMLEDALGGTSSAMLSQRAIAFVQRAYEAQGIGLADIQYRYLGRIALIMFLLCVGTLITTICVGFVAARTAATIARDTRRTLFDHVMSFSPAEVSKFSQASLITRSTNDIQQIQMVCTILMRMVMLAPIMGIVAFLQVTATHSGMEWIIGVGLLAILSVLGVLFGLTMPKFKRMQVLVDRLNLVSRDMLDGLMPIRAFGREGFELERFDVASTSLMRTQLFVNRAMAFMMPVIMFVMNLLTLLIVWVGSHGVDEGILQVGTMMAFITYAMQIVMSFMILGMVAVMLPRAQVAAERVHDVITCPLSIKDPAEPQTPLRDGPRGEVEFRDVSFRYPDAERPVVEHVSFKTSAGMTLGIIGSTGSGKTTLVKLIPRLYDATEGSVRIDGVDVRSMTVSDVRSRIGYVPQQGFLFSGTIESNIKFADEEMSDARMERAAEIAQALEFIDREPEGFGTPVSQSGSNVSGGQRQRLAIARALAAEPEILIFDDSFSALDYTTDARLRNALRKGAGNAAVVIVAQRVATIMQADEILVLENGAVIGRGTHRDLLQDCETYREIALSQLSPEELGLAVSRKHRDGASSESVAHHPIEGTVAEGGERS